MRPECGRHGGLREGRSAADPRHGHSIPPHLLVFRMLMQLKFKYYSKLQPFQISNVLISK